MQWSYSYARNNLCAGLSSHAHFIDLSIKSLKDPEPCPESHSQSIEQMGNHAEPIDAVGPHLSLFCSPLSLLDHILPYFVSRAYLPGMKPDAQITFRPEESASGKETGMQAS